MASASMDVPLREAPSFRARSASARGPSARASKRPRCTALMRARLSQYPCAVSLSFSSVHAASLFSVSPVMPHFLPSLLSLSDSGPGRNGGRIPGHGLREGRNPHRIAFLHPGEGLHPPSVHAHLTRAYPAVQEALWQPEMALQKADDLKPGLFSAHSQAPALLPVRAVFFHQNILPAGQKPAVRHPIPSGGSGKEARSLRTLPFQGTMAAVRRMTSGPDFNQEFFPWLPLTAGA